MKVDYAPILKNAYRITRKNRWLWIFGMLVALSSPGLSPNFDFLTKNAGDIPEIKNQRIEDQINNFKLQNESPFKDDYPFTNFDSKQVLGAATIALESAAATTTTTLEKSIKAVPITYIIISVLLIIGLVLVSWYVVFYASIWAFVSLIFGIKAEIDNSPLDLHGMSIAARPRTMEVFKIKLYPALISLAVFGTLLIGGLLTSGGSFLAMIAIGGLLFSGFFLVSLFLSMIIHMGALYIVFQNLTWKEGFKLGLSFTFKNLINVFIMGVINLLVGLAVTIAGFLLMIPLGIFGLVSFFLTAFMPFALVLLLPIGMILIVAFVFVMSVLNGILSVFKQATWMLFFNQVTAVPVQTS